MPARAAPTNGRADEAADGGAVPVVVVTGDSTGTTAVSVVLAFGEAVGRLGLDRQALWLFDDPTGSLAPVGNWLHVRGEEVMAVSPEIPDKIDMLLGVADACVVLTSAGVPATAARAVELGVAVSVQRVR